MRTQGDLPPAVFLDPWLIPQGDALKGLSEMMIEKVERNISTGLTQAARRDALYRRRIVVENLTANFVALQLSPHMAEYRLMAVPTDKRKQTRYDREGFPIRHLSSVLDALSAAGLIVRHPYIFKERSTTVELVSDLASEINRQGVRLADIGRLHGAEPIWLSARTGEVDFRDHAPQKRRVVYQDTHETHGLRSQMDRINGFANEADFRFAGQPQVPVSMRRMFLLRSEDAPHEFTLNGRLFSAWWQGVKSNQRHLITINGEDIADLDYSGCFLQLLYVVKTGRVFEGEPYAIPGLEEHRDGAKEAMLSLLSRSKPMKRLTPELRGLLPEGWNAQRLVDAFSRYHRAVADHFASDIGIELMGIESRLMVALLLQLEAMGIAAQCLHDGIQVGQSQKARAEEAMADVSEKLLGVRLPIKEKIINRPENLMGVAA